MLKVNAFLHQLKIQDTLHKTAKPEEATESKTCKGRTHSNGVVLAKF
jgi:hypothetical protein